MFALSFDTLSQAALFAATGASHGGVGHALALGLLFTVGMLVAFQMFASRMSQPLLRLVGLWQEFQQANIAVKRLVSPKDFRNNLNLYRGAVYGLSPEVAPWNHFPHRTPLRGLYQSGQTTYPGYSVARSAMAGILAAEALLAD